MQTDTSVIVTYRKNKERYLHECLGSIRNQTTKAAEVIIVEDCVPGEGPGPGPEDVIIKACEANLAAECHRIYQFPRLIGKAAQINKGIELATSEYLGICSADDFYEPTFIEESLGVLSEHGADVSWTNYNIVDDNRAVTQNYDAAEKTDADVGIEPIFLEKVTEWATTHGMFCCMATWFARRAVFQDVPFDEDLKLNEDFEWLLRAALVRKYNFVFVRKTLANYRVSATQISHTLSNMQLQLHNRYTWSKINMMLGKEIFPVPEGPIKP